MSSFKEFVISSLNGAGILFLCIRFGVFGSSRVDIYHNDILLGVSNRFLYHQIEYQVAGSDKTIRIWSFTPFYVFQSMNDRKID